MAEPSVTPATIEIKSRWGGAVLASKDLPTLRDALEAAVRDGAYLGGAYLGGADLRGAYLGGAYLRDLVINWNSHDLIAEILRRAAGEDVAKRKIAGLILVSRDWCWDNFLELRRDPLFGWALDALAACVRDEDNAPDVLRKRAAKAKKAEDRS